MAPHTFPKAPPCDAASCQARHAAPRYRKARPRGTRRTRRSAHRAAECARTGPVPALPRRRSRMPSDSGAALRAAARAIAPRRLRSAGEGRRRSFHQMREGIHHALIHRTLECDDKVRKVAHRLPAPLDEFRLVAAARIENVDFAVVAGKAQRVPLLRLPAEAALPGVLRDIGRQVVRQPFGDLAELLDRADVGLLAEFTQCRRPWVLALVDAALRHLPHMREVDVLRPLGTPPDEDESVAVEHHGADAGAIGEGVVGGHGHALRHAGHSPSKTGVNALMAGHPRLSSEEASKAWMAGSSP